MLSLHHPFSPRSLPDNSVLSAGLRFRLRPSERMSELRLVFRPSVRCLPGQAGSWLGPIATSDLARRHPDAVLLRPLESGPAFEGQSPDCTGLFRSQAEGLSPDGTLRWLHPNG